MTTKELSKVYQPGEVEAKWYDEWMRANNFTAKPDPSRKPFCIVIPPPNITGSLHMGHALDNTIQDLLIRWKRMEGFASLWIPGTDHAGIATQTVVEKELLKEKKTRHDLGRDEFVRKVWKWRDEYGRTIVQQLKRLGASADWSRERFTLDEQCSKSVKEAFIRLYRKGWIYRGKYIINWCPRCLTALSDLEVEHEDIEGKLYYVKYPFAKGRGGITIATTRPETILADTAVAVNPDDNRYKKYIGKEVTVPLAGRKVPVIADPEVKTDFGTGALKITPAHDPVDFEIGRRHNLPAISVLDSRGKMNEEAGPYAGMDRDKCRKVFTEDLRKGGFLIKEEEYLHAVGHCYRCNTVIEPYLSDQWFVKMKGLAEPAIKAVKDERVRFIPERYTGTYLYWMENIRDWCISRQLWWGHRIPVWNCGNCSFEDAYVENPDKCPKCGSHQFIQDSDVLDTWFSSALWPFSTMGWPDDTEDLKYFYPTSVLVTARDIIFLWVARMIMMGLEFMKDVPFRKVYIHATILDKEGRRMSKSKGTGIDPLELFNKYGTDATRFALAFMTAQGQDIKFSEEKMEMARNFANKIWNASRFVMRNMESLPAAKPWKEYTLNNIDRWILSGITKTIEKVTKSLEEYDIAKATSALYDFFWDDFCDWYIEMVKPVFFGEDNKEKEKIRKILLFVLENFYKLLHPFMPFITEELWHNLPGKNKNLIVESWPLPDASLFDEKSENEVNFIRDVIRGIRNLRSEINIQPQAETEAEIFAENTVSVKILKEAESIIKSLARINPLWIKESAADKPRHALTCRVGDTEVFLPLIGEKLVKELERLRKETVRINRDIESLGSKLKDEMFITKAPPAIVEKEKARFQDLKDLKEKIDERLKSLEGQDS